ncbi:MAG: S9 family peptidase [Acidobacteriota bacterium]|nr:S9 family peptidase [Blastocatellia bacterium]MDW8413108.1 S9 family peptidase [Acidobacteriota bacterium]
MRYLTPELLQQLKRLSTFDISPDGSKVVFSAAVPNVEKNLIAENLYLLDLGTKNARQLTYSTEHKNLRPKWRPDGRAIVFLSSRSGKVQLWEMPYDGGEARQLTDLPVDIESFLMFADGSFAAVCLVVAGFQTLDEIKPKETVLKMRIYDELPFRRWDTWDDGRFNHILHLSSDGKFLSDLTPEATNSPAWSESSIDDYAIAPDGEICFTRTVGNESIDGIRELFIRTNGKLLRLTHHEALCSYPAYSPDGRYLAYLRTLQPRLDGCNTYLTVYDRNTRKTYTFGQQLDRACKHFVWAPDSASLYFSIEDRTEEVLYRTTLDGHLTLLSKTSTIGQMHITPNGQQLLLSLSSINSPADLFAISVENPTNKTRLTALNDKALQDVVWGEVELFTYAGWNDEEVESWLIKPPNFDPTKTYPLLLIIHGGPHSCWSNNFHYRWNLQVFAAAGYIVIAPNFHGSSGYGQNFVDQLRCNWGGSAYEDLMLAVDHISKRPYIDRSRLAAAGASYGGYMANWIAGHTDRFRCIVSHAGLYNLISSVYASDFVTGVMEELGGTPWENIEALHHYSPSSYAHNFKTPMLIIHGQLDYRVDVSDGLAMFQTLKAKGIPARLIYFPDENHWILKPLNSIKWYEQVLTFLREWLRESEETAD